MNDNRIPGSSTPDLINRGPSPNYSSAFAALRPTPPVSGRSTPALDSSHKPSSQSQTPANDSFSNLVPWAATTSQKNLSLSEQQKSLAEKKSQGPGNSDGKNVDKLWGGDDQFWETLGSGRSTPAVPDLAGQKGRRHHGDPAHGGKGADQEDDLFAVFNGSTQSAGTAGALKHAPQSSHNKVSTSQISGNGYRGGHNFDDDDDPFELNSVKDKASASRPSQPQPLDDDDDVLGLLGQPARARPASPPALREQHSDSSQSHPQDRAVAELVEMGFPPDKARTALEQTESGMDVQGAVGWLLTQAHAEAKQKSRPRNNDGADRGNASSRDTRFDEARHGSRRISEEIISRPPARSSESPSRSQKDPTKVAAELGTTFLKTANSLWKQGSKKVQQAYQEFSSDSESGQQPKWMREGLDQQDDRERRLDEASSPSKKPLRRRSQQEPRTSNQVTDEVMMLESGGPPPKQPLRRPQEPWAHTSATNSRDHSPAIPSRLRETVQPPITRGSSAVPASRDEPRTKLTRQNVEEQASQAYVSSARRRRPAAASRPAVPPPTDNDLLENSSATLDSSATHKSPIKPSAPKPKNVPFRATVPSRNIPQVSPISLKASHSHREAGNASFKRGDFSSAHQSYTTSLSHLPSGHPITLVLLTNHALTALRIGESKTAISDSDKALEIIGTNKGEAETVDLQNGEPSKPMRDYYGKALMRKAEAFEQLEKWREASNIWQQAVEGGHGGASSIQARVRCEKAANPAPKISQFSSPRPSSVNHRTTKPPVTHRRLAGSTSAAAVSNLRATHAAQDRVEDEKFALSDSVSSKIESWKGGKSDNLRALLASLDTILGESEGWKKISMADLVLPVKVKVFYMKGIARVHPDKVRHKIVTLQAGLLVLLQLPFSAHFYRY